jgi:hypothetical protein
LLNLARPSSSIGGHHSSSLVLLHRHSISLDQPLLRNQLSASRGTHIT